MKRNLPPLNSLKAFEAAARHKSFTIAADELCVTQGAVSKQIKLLEDFIGKALFERGASGLVLTDYAQIYYKAIAAVLDNIDIATSAVCGNKTKDNILTVNILPSLSTYWLIPHIEDFKNKNPDLNVRMITGDGAYIDFKSLDADVAIRGNGHPVEGYENEYLMGEEMALVCSPCLIDEDKFSVDSITDYSLLEHTGRPYIWNNWMQDAGILAAKRSNVLSFEHFFMLIEAAKKGLGFAFVPDLLVKGDFEGGTLINPLGISHKTDFAYYLIYPKEKKRLKKVQCFSLWLKEYLTQMH